MLDDQYYVLDVRCCVCLMLFTLFLLLLAAAAYIAEDMKRIAQVSSNLEQLASPNHRWTRFCVVSTILDSGY